MSTHVAPELLEEAKRLREALREIEQATEGVPEQNCMIANRIARLTLGDARAEAAEERHWQDDADPKPGRAQAAYQAGVEKEKPGAIFGYVIGWL